MNSLILRTASRYLLVVLVVFSVFILLRGHNEPGGGFIGGLLAAGGLALYGLANGPGAVRRLIRVDPRTLIGAGLLCALAAALAGPLAGQPVLTGLWAPDPVPGIGKVSTVLLFDVGVDLVVIGAVVLILSSLGGRLMFPLLALLVGVLFGAGVYLLLARSMVRIIFGIVLVGHAVNLLIFTTGGLVRAKSPIVPPGGTVPVPGAADPVPQALVLTAIVIGFALTAFLAVLVKMVVVSTGTDDVDEIRRDDP